MKFGACLLTMALILSWCTFPNKLDSHFNAMIVLYINIMQSGIIQQKSH